MRSFSNLKAVRRSNGGVRCCLDWFLQFCNVFLLIAVGSLTHICRFTTKSIRTRGVNGYIDFDAIRAMSISLRINVIAGIDASSVSICFLACSFSTDKCVIIMATYSGCATAVQ